MEDDELGRFFSDFMRGKRKNLFSLPDIATERQSGLRARCGANQYGKCQKAAERYLVYHCGAAFSYSIMLLYLACEKKKKKISGSQIKPEILVCALSLIRMNAGYY